MAVKLQASATFAAHISYWNLTNSQWEPCTLQLDDVSLKAHTFVVIDPWIFTGSVDVIFSFCLISLMQE